MVINIILFDKIWKKNKKSWVKDGAIVPGQVGLSEPSTLVRGSYPH